MTRSLTNTVIYHVDTGASLEPLIKDMLTNAGGGWSEDQLRVCIQDMLDLGLLSDRDGTGYLKVTEAGWEHWRAQWITS